MDNQEILTRFKSGTLGRRHAVALLTGNPVAPPAPAVPAAAQAGAEPAAVIALQGRFPHAPDLEAFWQVGLEGRDTLGPVPAGRPGAAAASAAGHFLDGVDAFDPELFGIRDTDAALLDPQERLLLETARQVLEGAGYAGARLGALTVADGEPRAVGVFTAVGPPDYALLGAAFLADRTHPAGRLSRLLDLRGPSQSVDTGDSSFLTALHLALGSLRAGECAAALVAAAELRLHPARQRAGGGEGVAAVLLKPLSAALADGDRVHAVLRASAVGHAGRGEAGPMRERLVGRALAAAGAAASEVGLTEDSATVAACVGEAGAATGAAALARAVLQLRHATLLPGGADGPAQPLAWEGAAPRRALAGVHPGRAPQAVVLLEEAPPGTEPPAPGLPGPDADPDPELLLLSAPTPGHLAATARRIADWLERPEGAAHDLAAVAREVRVARAAMDCRLALVVRTTRELAGALAEFAEHGRAPQVRTADLRTAPGDPLLLGGLDETRAYVDALWRGERLEQLTRLWLGGLDVLTAGPAVTVGVPPVAGLPTTVPLPRPLWFTADAGRAGAHR